ncbi:MAG: phenylalanine--tRNA ligase subunit beta [Nitrososphaeraceae archaeon]
MPVVEVPLTVLDESFPTNSLEDIISSLPFIGLDIEGKTKKHIRIEYNPNRPDFSSSYGIVRALKGYLGLETGIPKYEINNDKKFKIQTTTSVKSIRPYIRALVAKGRALDSEIIKMLIDMQEDLHTGICNRRKTASIGLHNLERVRFPLCYSAVGSEVSFIPLDSSQTLSLNEILNSTDVGKKYSYLLGRTNEFPILLDVKKQVVSFPPIVNSKFTMLDNLSRGIFVEVTAIDPKVADLISAIYVATLSDLNFKVYHVTISENDGSSIKSPDMRPLPVSASFTEINRCLGTEFSREEIVRAAGRSRLGTKNLGRRTLTCVVPRYRNDVREVRDLIEEVMIGLGISKLSPILPMVNVTGSRNTKSVLIDKIKEVLVGLGLLEIRNVVIVSRFLQFESMGLKADESTIFKIENSLVSGQDILRNSLLPSLVDAIGHNIHSSYPQNIFEIGKVFTNGGTETEKWHLCVAVAYNRADYTSIKSILQAFLKVGFGKDVITIQSSHSGEYANGRSADIMVEGKIVGRIGEISDFVKQRHRIRVPVAAYEIDLSSFLISFRGSI